MIANSLRAHLRALPRSAKRVVTISVDVASVAAALLVTMLVLADSVASVPNGRAAIFGLVLLAALPVFLAFGLYQNVIRYMGSGMLFTVVTSVTTATILFWVFIRLSDMQAGLPAAGLVLHWLLTLLFVGGSRVVASEFLREKKARGELLERVIIYGAGDAGAQLAMSLNGKSGLKVIAFVDDNKDLSGSLLYGIKVRPASELPDLIDEYEVRQILLALPSASKARLKEIFGQIEQLRVRIRTIPRFGALIDGRAKISDIEDVHIEDLLGREPVPPMPTLLAKCISGKVVLVTGAGGSIGSELCRQIQLLAPSKLVLLDHSEYALYAIHEDLLAFNAEHGNKVELVPLLASVAPNFLLGRILADHHVNTIYHAAAYKHVPLVESNPCEAIRNNVIGTLRVAEAAVAGGVDNVVLISTDKAVRPTSVMGASKRMAELVMQGIKGGGTKICMVRFGNVLESSGSVVPLFRKQIQDGGPITVTHPEIIRYFMTIPEAAQLVLQAGSMAVGGDVFVLDMGSPVKILDLARRMVHLSGLTVCDADHPSGNIEIKFTGLRPGEKLYEELLIGNNPMGTEHPLIMRAMEESVPWPKLQPLLDELDAACSNSDVPKAMALLNSVVPLFSAKGN